MIKLLLDKQILSPQMPDLTMKHNTRNFGCNKINVILDLKWFFQFYMHQWSQGKLEEHQGQDPPIHEKHFNV